MKKRYPKKKETLAEKIESWWSYTKTYKIEIPYRNFVRGVKNIIKWAPLVWKDADWDYRYITTILRFKLENTANYIESKQRHLDYKQDVKYMRICVNLIDKIWGSDDLSIDIDIYENEYSSYHKSEFNWIEDESTPKDCVTVDIMELSNNFDDYFAKNKLMLKKAIDYLKVNKSWREPNSKNVKAMVISKLKHEKAKKLLFKILNEKIETFWD